MYCAPQNAPRRYLSLCIKQRSCAGSMRVRTCVTPECDIAPGTASLRRPFAPSLQTTIVSLATACWRYPQLQFPKHVSPSFLLLCPHFSLCAHDSTAHGANDSLYDVSHKYLRTPYEHCLSPFPSTRQTSSPSRLPVRNESCILGDPHRNTPRVAPSPVVIHTLSTTQIHPILSLMLGPAS